jgi:putative addiction module component (TIGR02574 family)
MSKALTTLKAQALQLDPTERGELIGALIDSLERQPDESPETVAAAWESEIAQRLADVKAGKTRFIPFDDAMHTLRSGLVTDRP